MTVPTHFKFTFRGEFAETPEIWTFGMHFSRTEDNGQDAGLGDINQGDVTAALDALLSGAGSATFNGNVHATDWRAYQIGTNGRMEGNPLVVDVSEDGISGAGGTTYPPQIALVVTSVADNRGPARFGRFYLPGPSAALAAGMRLSAVVAEAYHDVAVTFVKAVSDAIDLPLLQSSELLNISDQPAGGGTKQSVDHLEVGRVYDTLRTRRNQLLEERFVGGHIDW